MGGQACMVLTDALVMSHIFARLWLVPHLQKFVFLACPMSDYNCKYTRL